MSTPASPADPSLLAATARTLRGLAMDAVQKANSGHPGAPMGMADMATVLWTRVLKYDPADAAWADRDRVVLSNGHASMLLYGVLHLTGTRSEAHEALTLDDLKNFRQLHSPTAGHPEYGEAAGIETTTGPLGQGLANGVGMALAEGWLRARFGADLVDHHTWVFVGDGCLMEGISQEAISLAGHLGLGRLNVLYDDNRITIDGETDLAFSEDQTGRFEASGWEVLDVDGHDLAALEAAMLAAKGQQERPTLIRCRTTIAKGSPGKAGTSASHGAPLGDEEIRATKEAIGLDPDQTFAVPDEVLSFVRDADAGRGAQRSAWLERLAEHPEADAFAAWMAAPDLGEVAWPTFEVGSKLATRKASAAVLNAIAAKVPQLLGGSADLAGSNGSMIKGGGYVQKETMGDRNLAFGVREHAMASICNGLTLHGGVRPYCATFLVFHDYMRPSCRLAALMGLPVTYVYTHDSIFVGEDGPTHQPIEQLMAMRTIPNLWVVRPADAWEASEAWKLAMTREDGPVALCFTRQGLPVLDRSQGGMAGAEGLARGAYVLSEADGEPAAVVVGTGSEVHLALSAQQTLQAEGVAVRVVSMPCWEAFEALDADEQDAVLPPGVPTVSVEAGISFGWSRFADAHVGIDRFGASAPGAQVAEDLGLTADAVVDAVRGLLG